MSKTYYAMNHYYGARTGDENGNHIGDVYEFATKAARDEWVDDGPSNPNDSGGRTALRMSKPCDRRAIEYYKREVEQCGRMARNYGDRKNVWEMEGMQ